MPPSTLAKLNVALDRRKKHRDASNEAFADVRSLCKALHDEGMTLREIAEIAGVSHVAVRWWIRDRS